MCIEHLFRVHFRLAVCKFSGLGESCVQCAQKWLKYRPLDDLHQPGGAAAGMVAPVFPRLHSLYGYAHKIGKGSLRHGNVQTDALNLLRRPFRRIGKTAGNAHGTGVQFAALIRDGFFQPLAISLNREDSDMLPASVSSSVCILPYSIGCVNM